MGLIVVRYGEIALKGGNRRYFVKKLRDNIRDCLRQHRLAGKVTYAHGRIYVDTPQVEEALASLSRVFGIVSLSPALMISGELAPAAQMVAIKEAALTLAREMGLDAAHSFRIGARRANKAFPWTSPQISREVGSFVQEATGGRVDLSAAADVTIEIEIRSEGALVYGRTIPGPGGLPLGVGGWAVALISGGIDSPVAAWMMMKRGCAIIPVHFAQSEVETAKALDNIEILKQYAYGQKMRPIILSYAEVFGETARQLYEIGAASWICIFCKRTFLLRAAEIAAQHGAGAVVTGESLGQVASQTLDNLEVVSHGVPKPILRPLIGLDKVEIMDIAARIGTFAISTRESAPCPYLPDRPLTKSTVGQLQKVLERLAEWKATQGSDHSVGPSA